MDTHEIDNLVSTLEPELAARRRDFHRHAESGWTEFRTASLVARHLKTLGFQTLVGEAVLRPDERMGLPPEPILADCWERARREGGDPEYLEQMRGGMTAVVGVLEGKPGPTVAIRFDMDALDLQESDSASHRPAREQFASIHPRVAHACGHDAHTAVGLAVASLLAPLKDELHGAIKLLFQPAEEGVRGAKAMVAAGVVDDVDLLFGNHFFSGWAVGEIATGMGGYLATHKFDARFHGRPAHAGGSPQAGRNALMAAATAVLNLYAIPRHAKGRTRVNVGRLEAGVGRNVIPAEALLVIETRGDNSELDAYMVEQAERILQAAAGMHHCTLEITPMGSAVSAASSSELAQRVAATAQRLGGFQILPTFPGSGSEDFCYMMNRVQENGGLATFIGSGADLNGVRYHQKEGRDAILAAHTAEFDIDERALGQATRLLTTLVLDALSGKTPAA